MQSLDCKLLKAEAGSFVLTSDHPVVLLNQLFMEAEPGEQNSPNAITKEKVAEIAADFMTTFYHVQVGALETQEFRAQPGPVLARLLFGRDQRTTATNVFRRSAAGWDGCCAQRVEAAVDVGERIGLSGSPVSSP
jgi:hypothetical protein